MSRRLQLLGIIAPVFLPVQDVLINNWGFNLEKPINFISIGIINLNPSIRGTIIVAHSDPEAYPSITFNPLENQDDLNFLVDQYIETFNIILKAREIDPGGIYNVVYPSENIFLNPTEEEKRNQLAAFARGFLCQF